MWWNSVRMWYTSSAFQPCVACTVPQIRCGVLFFTCHSWYCARHKISSFGRRQAWCQEWSDGDSLSGTARRKEGVALQCLLATMSYVRNITPMKLRLLRWNSRVQSRACGRRCAPPTSPSETVLTISFDAPGHLYMKAIVSNKHVCTLILLTW
jgi:hypothetical protein